jgi:hypothetical protein
MAAYNASSQFTQATGRPVWELSGLLWFAALCRLDEATSQRIPLLEWATVTLGVAKVDHTEDIDKQLLNTWQDVKARDA